MTLTLCYLLFGAVVAGTGWLALTALIDLTRPYDENPEITQREQLSRAIRGGRR